MAIYGSPPDRFLRGWRAYCAVAAKRLVFSLNRVKQRSCRGVSL